MTLIVCTLVFNQNDKSSPTTISQAKLTFSNKSPLCRSDNSKQFVLDSLSRQSIELAVIGQIIDVPAGTNADIRLTTYSKTIVTGSEVYTGNFGKYNFTASKVSDASDWRVTEFVACK